MPSASKYQMPCVALTPKVTKWLRYFDATDVLSEALYLKNYTEHRKLFTTQNWWNDHLKVWDLVILINRNALLVKSENKNRQRLDRLAFAHLTVFVRFRNNITMFGYPCLFQKLIANITLHLLQNFLKNSPFLFFIFYRLQKTTLFIGWSPVHQI